MSALAASSLVANMPSEILRRTDSIKFVLECSNQTLNDKKFWKVRYVLCDPLDIRATTVVILSIHIFSLPAG